MSKFQKFLPLVAALALATPAAAQESDENSQLSMGEEVTQNAPQPYILETNGDWEVKCLKVEGIEKDPCEMYQLMKDEAGNPTAEVSMFRLEQGGKAVAGATITVPLETLLTEQLLISVDGSQPKRYPYSFCNPIGCYARIGLTQEDVDVFKKGSAATVTIVPAVAPDQQVNLSMSLSGFTKSFDQVAVVGN